MRLHQRLRREHGRHTDDWLITYADTITLLLCLFVIILSIRTAEKTVRHDAVAPEVVAGDNAMPNGGAPMGGVPMGGTAMGGAPMAVPSMDAAPVGGVPVDQAANFLAPIAPPVTRVPLFVVPVLANTFMVPVRRAPETEGTFAGQPPVSTAARSGDADDTPAEASDDADARLTAATPRESGPATAAPIRTLAHSLATGLAPPSVAGPSPPTAAAADPEETSLPAIVDRLNAHGTAIVEQRGDRITTLQINSAAFYGSGQATIGDAGKAILRDIAVTLKSAAFAAYHISIEGHTDDMPISTAQFQSNWELSTARAAAVVRFLLEQGIAPGKLSAAGYADTFPTAPNRAADGTAIPENQARNRRVVIRLEKLDVADRKTD